MEREAFLRRISERLGRPRPARPSSREPLRLPEPLGVSPLASRPPPADPVLRFKVELEAVGGEVRVAESLCAAHEALRAALASWAAGRVVTWARAEFEAWSVGWLWDELGARAWLEPPLDSEAALRRALLECQIGVTTVDRAIVGTGTLVLTSAPGRPRAVSLLPTVHVALVRESELVADMGQVLSALGAAEPPSAVHFVTGPSRTSDIENDLTIGVHGPAAVSVVLFRDRTGAAQGEPGP
jgi:L-lactate dehydrogenase complex protein LldG